MEQMPQVHAPADGVLAASVLLSSTRNGGLLATAVWGTRSAWTPDPPRDVRRLPGSLAAANTPRIARN